MPSENSMKVFSIMAREMGHMGKFIVKKQCDDLNIDVDNIPTEALDKLASALAEAIVMFTGKDKADRVRSEIRKMREQAQ